MCGSAILVCCPECGDVVVVIDDTTIVRCRHCGSVVGLNTSSDDGNIQTRKQQSFKVYIHTLEQFTACGSGTFAMSTLKRMTGTESFKQLPEKQKKCLVHNREDCQTQKYLDQIENNCGCTPWALKAAQQKHKVR